MIHFLGEAFTFIDQKHYDILGSLVAKEIQRRMQTKYGLKEVLRPQTSCVSANNIKLLLPLDASPEESRIPVFVSPNYRSAPRLLVLSCGAGLVECVFSDSVLPVKVLQSWSVGAESVHQ